MNCTFSEPKKVNLKRIGLTKTQMMKNFKLTGISLSIILIILLSSCSKPFDKIKNKTWSGQIYRLSDKKELSDVRLKMSNDTLYLFSNAIFGSENDTLILAKYEEKDSILIYNNPNHSNKFTFKFNYKLSDNSDNLYLIGNDYIIFLIPSVFDIKNKEVLNFYRNITVPIAAYMYLDGTYKGDIEMENGFADLLLTQMEGASIKMVFLDGFQVKIFFKSLFTDMFASLSKPSYEIVDYRFDGNKLIFDRNKSKARRIEVKDDGETLVLETDVLNVEMHKIN